MTVRKKTFENSVGKAENAGNQHFVLFQQYFLDLPFWKQISIFGVDLHLMSANASNFVIW